MRRSLRMAPRPRRYSLTPGDENVPLTAIRWRRLYRYLRPYAGRMVVVIIALGLSSAVSLAFPLMIVNLLDSVLSQKNQGQLNLLALTLAGLFLFQSAVSFFQSFNLASIGERIVLDLRTELYGHLHALSLDFYANRRVGEIIALVGPSGAGKSTLFNLIPRFYDPSAGTVTIDGVDLRTVSQTSLRAQIGIVPQETLLFGGTVRDNILYGRLDASDEAIVAAARAANAHDFIMALPRGYETIVGERGIKLSGGQRQRVAIARALLKDPRILLLDEATSSLDSESEGLVQEALDRLMQGRTTVIIAHRLSTIKAAHRIAVLDGGRLVELGTHDALMALGGLYARLYAMQFHDPAAVRRGLDAVP